jgi:predicted RND superfamily exporter protein
VVDGVPVRIEVGEEVWRIRAQCSVLTDRHYADFLDEIDAVLDEELHGYPGVEHLTTGMVPLFLRTQDALLESLINSFGVAFATIAAVMMYQIRSVAAGALVMLPNILPIALVFGLISWYGIPLDVGTMITASIAMGISVDSELHFVSWFRQSLQQGLSREEAVANSLVHCGPAMWQSCLVISLALLMLVFTDLLMISRFGWLMASMILMALLADLFYMPALLGGIMGRVLERQVARQRTPQSARTDERQPEVATSR